ncbi:uncharacterized protein LOC116223197 [Clupea harengus]|uniref:Uncharacterized protein LOC116223197 n=1 Tax=Clupea harengus TaxID=7950 RepID=A0A6P8GJ67_CLUHA|nr:uncharacterized protein LOC116223197 [Clupea harengus]
MAAQPENENPIRVRKNAKGFEEHYVCREHIVIDDMERRNWPMRLKTVAQPNEQPRMGVVPHYPRPVEFHCSIVSHVTTTDGMTGIRDLTGFRGGDRRLLWWGTLIGEDEITTAEERYLEKLFPKRSPEERERQKPFLHEFTTSPVFTDGSRYGNFRFTFSLADVMNAYRSQFCGEEEPVLRVYETVTYTQEVMYVVLIHSPDVHDYDDYPVCAYKDGEIIWHAQAISQTHSYRLIENRDEKQVEAVEYGDFEFYVWDHMSLAFHMPEGTILEFSLETLLEALTACDIGHIKLNDFIGRERAEEIIQEMKANA